MGWVEPGILVVRDSETAGLGLFARSVRAMTKHASLSLKPP